MSSKQNENLSPTAGFFNQNILIFHAVCESRSFTEAARRLGLSQSAVSQGVASLESRLHLQLFNRETRPLTLTTEAILLNEQLSRQIGEANAVLSAVKTKNFVPPTIRIGLIESVGRRIGVKLISGLLERSRHVEITTGYSDSLYQALLEERLDCIVANGNCFDAPNLIHQLLYSEPYVVMLPKVVASRHKHWTWADLSLCGIPFIRYSKTTNTGKEGAEVLRHAFLDLPQRFSIDDNQTIFSLVAAGMGWCLTNPLTALLSQEFSEHIALLPSPTSTAERLIFVVSRKTTPAVFSSEVFDLATKALKDTIPQMTKLMPWTEYCYRLSPFTRKP